MIDVFDDALEEHNAILIDDEVRKISWKYDHLSHKEKIIQLNRAKAIVINVYGPNDLETVESTWEGAGISHPSAAVSFNGGITWANKNGCYLYDGETVLNLIDNRLALETWRNFILSGVGEH